MNIQNILKDARNTSGLSQTQLAKLSGVSIRTIGKLEQSPNVNVSIGILNVLAKAMNKRLEVKIK